MSQHKDQNQYFNEITKDVMRYVIAIYKNINNELEFIGTGWPLAYRYRIYIVTANHVIEHFKDDLGSVRFGINGETRGFRKIKSIQINDDPQNNLKNLDVGAWIVTEPGRHESTLIDSAMPSTLIYQRGLDSYSYKHLVTVGLPSSKNKKSKKESRQTNAMVNGIGYSYIYEKNLSFDLNSIGKHSDRHISITWPKRDGYGQEVVKPRGLSGSAVWALPVEENHEKKVIGIFIEYHQSVSVGICTRADLILRILDFSIDHLKG